MCSRFQGQAAKCSAINLRKIIPSIFSLFSIKMDRTDITVTTPIRRSCTLSTYSLSLSFISPSLSLSLSYENSVLSFLLSFFGFQTFYPSLLLSFSISNFLLLSFFASISRKNEMYLTKMIFDSERLAIRQIVNATTTPYTISLNPSTVT